MKPDEIGATYDRLAGHWDGPDFNRRNGIAQHRRALHFVKDRGRAIDIGCGSSGRIIQLLLDEGFEVEGLDVSAEMLRRARRRHPGVDFHHVDVGAWEPAVRYDFISAWDSIWHAPLERHEAILEKLCGALAEGGVMIFTSGGIDEPEERSEEMMGQPIYHAALGIPKLLEVVAAGRCVCRHMEYDQWPEPHLYLIVQRAG